MDHEKLKEVEAWLQANRDLWEDDPSKYEALKETRFRYITLLYPSQSIDSGSFSTS